MKKKLLMIMLFITIALSVSAGAGLNPATAEAETGAERFSAEYLANVSNSRTVYTQVMSAYRTATVGIDGKETIAYSDDFAGVFIDDDGLLNIGIVGATEKTL